MEHSVLGLKPGSIIQDTYKVEALLGQGGMGATFKGLNMATGHEVAIKVMSADFARETKAVELFRRESQLLRSVQNPAVVRYETTLQDSGGKLYLVMEYVPGRSLAHYVRRGGRLDTRDVMRLGARLASGLASIHALGIVHRDVAPDNVMLPDGDVGAAKFIDFGLASATAGTEKSIIGDSFAGKLGYSAPEQLGLFENRIGPATDIYALGLLLVKVAGFVPPGEGKGWAAAADRGQDWTAPPEMSKALAPILEGMLRADPAARSAAPGPLFETALARLKDAPPAPADPSVGAGHAPPEEAAARGLPLPVLGIAAVAVLGLVAGGGFVLLRDDGGAEQSRQVEAAAAAVAAADPLAETVALIDAGGTDNLNAALGALIALARDDQTPAELRARAAVMAAEMYDPVTFDPLRSPFDRPNPGAALRFYRQASDLGAPEATAAVTRLEQEQ